MGTFLVPRLVEAGYEVVSVSRGRREPYRSHPAWRSVEQVTERFGEQATCGRKAISGSGCSRWSLTP